MYDLTNTLERRDSNLMTSNTQVANPFGGNSLQQSSIGTAQAVSHELAEMQAQIYLAKQFPRDQRRATEQILTACQRPGLASVAVYSYSKGGTSISGPSIRLAEEIARNWGNLECGWNELEREGDASKLRAFAWDKETNVLKTLFFYVPHYRTTKQGRKRITDERELYELLANQASRRMRNCILALIPGDVVDSAVEQCERTMVTHCEITPETIKRLVEAFVSFGVSRKQIEKRIQRNIESITPAQFVRMREIYTSLKDGMSDPSDWFDTSEEINMEETQMSATENLKNALATSKRGSKQSKKREQEPVQANKEETKNNDKESIKEGIRKAIESATTDDELFDLSNNIMAREDFTIEEQDELIGLINERNTKLQY